MTETLQNWLVLAYSIMLCVLLVCWGVWRRWLDGISAGQFARRGLACAYWFLSFTVLADIFASLKIRHDDLTSGKFTILLVMALVMMLQIALVALVIVPVLMRLAPRAYSLTKSLIIMESGAFIAILAWAIAFITFMHDYRQLAK